MRNARPINGLAAILPLLIVAMLTILPRTADAQMSCQDIWGDNAATVYRASLGQKLQAIIHKVSQGTLGKRSFDSSTFDGFKNALDEGRLEKIDFENPQPELILAIVERMSAESPGGLEKIASIMTHGTNKQKQSLVDTIQSINPKHAIEESPSQRLMVQLYTLAHPEVMKLKFLLAPRGYIRAMIQRRVEVELARNDFVTGLEKLGFVREPGLRASLRRWYASHSSLFNGAISVAMNAASISFMGMPYTVMRGGLLNTMKISPHLLERARIEGVEAVMPEFLSHYQGPAMLDRAFRTVRISVSSAFIGILAFYGVQYAPQIRLAIDFAMTTQADVQQYARDNFDAQIVRQQQLDSWRESYKEFQGHEPSAQEIAAMKAELAAQPDSLFRLEN